MSSSPLFMEANDLGACQRSPASLTWLESIVGGDLGPDVATLVQSSSSLLSARVLGTRRSLQPAEELVRHGGKRARMTLTALISIGLELESDAAVALSAAAELVHGATLIHDDVIDQGAQRRGAPAAHEVFGNKRAVLGGDALLVEALKLLSERNLHGALGDMLSTLDDLLEGEYLQMERQSQLPPDLGVAEQINRLKTASLFGWCAGAPARVAGAPDERTDALRRFGFHLGEGFQLIDDLLDLCGQRASLGKPGMQDLRDGKLNRAMCLLLEERPALLAPIEAFWATGEGTTPPPALLSGIDEAIWEVRLEARLRTQAQELFDAGYAALEVLPSPKVREALIALATHLAARTQ